MTTPDEALGHAPTVRPPPPRWRVEYRYEIRQHVPRLRERVWRVLTDAVAAPVRIDSVAELLEHADVEAPFVRFLAEVMRETPEHVQLVPWEPYPPTREVDAKMIAKVAARADSMVVNPDCTDGAEWAWMHLPGDAA